jgi:hypothetical protein
MLIDSKSNFSADDVILLKNILGEEIICAYVTENDTHYTIKGPYAMTMTEKGPAFVPAITFADTSGEIRVRKEHFLFALPAHPEIEPSYTQMTSGIVMPKKSGKIIT